MMEMRFFIGATVTLGIFVLGHIFTAVWWAAKMTANVASMAMAIDRLTTTLDKHDNRFYDKKEAKEQIARRDQEVKDIWIEIKRVRTDLQKCQLSYKTK